MSENQVKMQGWGFDGNNSKSNQQVGVHIQTNNVAQQKMNVWEQTNEELIVVPDLDEEKIDNENRQVSHVENVKVQQIKNFHELQRATRQFQLPKPDDDVDLTILMQFMRPYNEICENDETWDFGTLKRETYEAVTNLYGISNNQEEN